MGENDVIDLSVAQGKHEWSLGRWMLRGHRDAAGSADRIEAFAAVYRQNWAHVLRFFCHRVPSIEDAEDLSATTFLVAWRRFDEMPVGLASRTWLMAAARYSLVNYWRGYARRNRRDGLLRAQSMLDRSHQLSDVRDAGTEVAEAFSELSPGHREVLWLIACEGLSHNEAARQLGCSRQALDNRLSRARSALRARLESRRGRDPGISSG